MKWLVTLSFSLFVVVLNAQTSLQQVVEQVESNNQRLKALRLQADAQLKANHTGLAPSDPQVGFTHQWGQQGTEGTRRELTISQSFDFPSAYIHRNRLATHQDAVVMQQYQQAYNQVVLEVLNTCYLLGYQNALLTEYEIRVGHGMKISDAYHQKFNAGGSTIIERNKADLNLMSARSRFEQLMAERDMALQRLQALNGGQSIEFNTHLHSPQDVPVNFDLWFKEHEGQMPALQAIMAQQEAAQTQVQLNRSLSLPKLTGGYAAETMPGESFKGISAGVSIPLWENKNTVKQAKLTAQALETASVDARLNYYHGLKALHQKAARLQALALDYRETMARINNNELLSTALNSGEISILEFMVEQAIYYDAIEAALSNELELAITTARLMLFMPEED